MSVYLCKHSIQREPHFANLNAAIMAYNAAAPLLGQSAVVGDLGGQCRRGKSESLRGQGLQRVIGIAETLHQLANDLAAFAEDVAVNNPLDIDRDDEVDEGTFYEIEETLPILQKVALLMES